MEFEWDPAKHERNQSERGFGFDVAAFIFESRVVEFEDRRFVYGEARVVAIGAAGDDVLVVTYTDRGGVRRIISARKANRRERRRWLTSV